MEKNDKYCKFCAKDVSTDNTDHWLKESNKKSKTGYYLRCRLQIAERTKQYRKNNKELIKQRWKKWYSDNSEYNKQRYEEYYADNKYEIMRRANETSKVRRKKDEQFRLKCNLRSSLSNAIRRRINNRSIEHKESSLTKSLGCSVSELMYILEGKFTAEMTWDNYGTCWEVDHIKPLCEFDLTNEEQVVAANNWSNIQPLTREENMKKGSKYGTL